MHRFSTKSAFAFVGVVLMLVFAVHAAQADTYRQWRELMVHDLVSHAERSRAYVEQPEFSEPVLQALRTVPRHEFVPSDQKRYAYENRPLPIGYGQTISQPYIVALMTELLKPNKTSVMLEVGTGSGYQAAILGQLVDKMYSIEIIPALAEQATARIAQLGYTNIETKGGDGYFGWPERGPFDGIVVTAAADHVPPPLVEQLKPGGRMVIPVGDRFTVQELLLIEKGQDGVIRTRHVLPVRFVPLLGEHENR